MHSPPTRLLKEHGYIHPTGQIPTGAIRGQALGFGQYGKGGAARDASNAVLAALRLRGAPLISGYDKPLTPAVATAEEIVLSKASDFVKGGSLLSGGGKPPKTSKGTLFNWSDDSWDEGFHKADVQGSPISRAELDEVLAGYVLSEESMEHFYEAHRYSAESGKTFIPDEWTKEDYESATRAVIKSARYYYLLGDQITFRG